MVSYTFTIESIGGNAVTVPGYGFLLNNELTDFNYDDTTFKTPNRPEGSKRPRSSMSPTLITRRGKPFMAVGSPGGSTIIGTVLGILVHGDNHFIARGPLPDREVLEPAPHDRVEHPGQILDRLVTASRQIPASNLCPDGLHRVIRNCRAEVDEVFSPCDSSTSSAETYSRENQTSRSGTSFAGHHPFSRRPAMHDGIIGNCSNRTCGYFAIVLGNRLFDVLDLKQFRRAVSGIDGGFHKRMDVAPAASGSVESAVWNAI